VPGPVVSRHLHPDSRSGVEAASSPVADNPHSVQSRSSVLIPAAAAPTLERPRTRLQDGIVQPKIITDGHIRYDKLHFANFCSSGDKGIDNRAHQLSTPEAH
jgi:hypothetical protein